MGEDKGRTNTIIPKLVEGRRDVLRIQLSRGCRLLANRVSGSVAPAANGHANFGSGVEIGAERGHINKRRVAPRRAGCEQRGTGKGSDGMRDSSRIGLGRQRSMPFVKVHGESWCASGGNRRGCSREMHGAGALWFAVNSLWELYLVRL